MKNQKNKCILLILFLTLLTKSEANTIDSLSEKTDNKISIEFAGGISYTNYLFLQVYIHKPLIIIFTG